MAFIEGRRFAPQNLIENPTENQIENRLAKVEEFIEPTFNK